MSEYLSILKRSNIAPNFWCSEEYFHRAGLEERREGAWIYIWDPKADVCVFPPVHVDWGMINCPFYPWTKKFWSDFLYYQEPSYNRELLDLEYIYDPAYFQDISGRIWSVFRKNSRKFPARHKGNLQYIAPDSENDTEIAILLLIQEWLGAQEKVFHEIDVMVDFALHGENRRILIGNDGELFGINVWDENWLRLNYRLCICKPGLYLSEYMRLRFYTDPAIITKGKLVNDGGVLDNPNLKAFKDKLHPVRVREVYSWVRRS